VELKGEPEAVVGKLAEEGSALSGHPEAEEALEDMRQLVQILNCMGAPMHRLRQGHAEYARDYCYILLLCIALFCFRHPSDTQSQLCMPRPLKMKLDGSVPDVKLILEV
jgi:hypothetical protein